MPAPAIRTNISLLATPKNTLAIPAKMPTLAIILAILALSIKFNDYSLFLWFLALSTFTGSAITVAWHKEQYPY